MSNKATVKYEMWELMILASMEFSSKSELFNNMEPIAIVLFLLEIFGSSFNLSHA